MDPEIVLLLKTSGEVSIVNVRKDISFIVFLQSLIEGDIYLHSIQRVTSQAVQPSRELSWICISHVDALSDTKLLENPFCISPSTHGKLRGNIVICFTTDTAIYGFRYSYLNFLPPRIRNSLSQE